MLALTTTILVGSRSAQVEAGIISTSSPMVEMDVSSSGGQQQTTTTRKTNFTQPSWVADLDRVYQRYPRTEEQRRKSEQRARHRLTQQRERERRTEKAQRVLSKIKAPPLDEMERMDAAEIDDLPEEQKRRLSWFSGGGGGSSSGTMSSEVLADTGEYYDMWAQAYRMLGGFIDCDHHTDEGSGDSGNNNNNNEYEGEGDAQPCSRWMMWAAVRIIYMTFASCVCAVLCCAVCACCFCRLSLCVYLLSNTNFAPLPPLPSFTPSLPPTPPYHDST